MLCKVLKGLDIGGIIITIIAESLREDEHKQALFFSHFKVQIIFINKTHPSHPIGGRIFGLIR